MKPIYLEIQSFIQPGAGLEPQTIKQQLEGFFEERPSEWVVRYTETPGTDEEIRTTVKADTEEVTVIRQGMVSYRTTYRPGQETFSLIEVPGGTSEMEVMTKTYQRNQTSDGGMIQFTFDLKMGNEEMGQYQLRIQWTEVPD
ncbi:DUF1934 domain-containing protein [Kroppenstedtia pulmonis]|uniref:DUF1934 domain-containing protein n=1 Tax=Kroppenstedtia pulmonis TaxID=1380685 RepID=A0A7D4CX84_9BACL|nr:DUF1934 domain-containing protein [Kroppenstedtia pulmonis]QKG85777.1 DUF1934 domain-containing protein [Kroppenstedtia pulmonis]